MSAPRGRLVMLAVVGGLLAVVLMWRFAGGPSPAASPIAAGPKSPAGPQASAPVVDVRMELLQQGEQGEQGGRRMSGTERNPFRFRPPPAPPRAAVAAVRTAPPPILNAPVSGPPPPPPITLRFIGFVDPTDSDNRAAFFSDTRGNVFIGREGEVIEGRYRLLRVGPDSTEIAYLDGRGRTTIRLSGQ